MNHSSNIAVLELRRERSVDSMLFLDLFGPLRLTDTEGVDLTPRSRKAQGLLALVGTSPGLRRSRAWLQDKLWSNRGPEQGAASLRQCLTNVRLGLGRHVDCLKTEAGWIALDPGKVRVRSEPADSDADGGLEFLEGLDIRDPEFEHWIRDQRLHYAERADRSARGLVQGGAKRAGSDEPVHGSVRPTVGLATQGKSRGSDAEHAVSNFALDLVARSLLGCADVDVIDFRVRPDMGRHCTPLVGPDWLLHAASSVLGDRVRLTLKLSRFGEGLVLWTDTATFDLADFYGPEQLAVDAFADCATQSVLKQAHRQQMPSAHMIPARYQA
jgi:hypothetical protein